MKNVATYTSIGLGLAAVISLAVDAMWSSLIVFAALISLTVCILMQFNGKKNKAVKDVYFNKVMKTLAQDARKAILMGEQLQGELRQ